jgi:hypothetical protein
LTGAAAFFLGFLAGQPLAPCCRLTLLNRRQKQGHGTGLAESHCGRSSRYVDAPVRLLHRNVAAAVVLVVKLILMMVYNAMMTASTIMMIAFIFGCMC